MGDQEQEPGRERASWRDIRRAPAETQGGRDRLHVSLYVTGPKRFSKKNPLPGASFGLAHPSHHLVQVVRWIETW